jgi:hypothetical protein
LLIKKIGRKMLKDVVPEELEDLGICVQRVIQLSSGRRNQEADKANPHLIVSVPRGPQVAKNPSPTENCGLRISVERHNAAKGPLQCKRSQTFGQT